MSNLFVNKKLNVCTEDKYISSFPPRTICIKDHCAEFRFLVGTNFPSIFFETVVSIHMQDVIEKHMTVYT